MLQAPRKLLGAPGARGPGSQRAPGAAGAEQSQRQHRHLISAQPGAWQRIPASSCWRQGFFPLPHCSGLHWHQQNWEIVLTRAGLQKSSCPHPVPCGGGQGDMVLWDMIPKEAGGQMLPSGVGRNLAVLPTLPVNSLRDPIQKAFLGQKSPWTSTGSGTEGFKYFQPLFEEGGAGGLQGFWLHQSTVQPEPFLFQSIPAPVNPCAFRLGKGRRKEWEGCSSAAEGGEGDRGLEEPSPPSPLPNQPRSCHNRIQCSAWASFFH